MTRTLLAQLARSLISIYFFSCLVDFCKEARADFLDLLEIIHIGDGLDSFP